MRAGMCEWCLQTFVYISLWFAESDVYVEVRAR